MDADRVRSYLQVACAGLGFDIGEVWWMSNESGTSTVAAIEEKCGHESDSSGEGTYAELMKGERMKSAGGSGSVGAGVGAGPRKLSGRKSTPKKRFLQLYTSKAYCNQRSKLVQPHDNDDGPGIQQSNGSAPGSPASRASPKSPSSSSRQLIRRTSSFASMELDEEHVLSPRIVEAVTHSTQVVWANCQKTEGLLGRSDIKLQTAIGMPVGVDESGNVWVVVMFSPKNVESSVDAIDYLQYISRSAASTSIPCLLPVVGDVPPSNNGGGGTTKMICDGSATDVKAEAMEATVALKDGHHSHSLVSIKPNTKQPEHTQELGDGVTAKFVSFNLNDDDENDKFKSPGGTARAHRSSLGNENDLRNAPKDDWGIPMLPETAELVNNGGQTGNNGANGNSNSNNSQSVSQQTLDAIDNAITDAFDEASYGVWSTIMNSAGGEVIRTSESIATKMHLIQERLEEFATAFLGMSVFDVADAWTVSSGSVGPNGEAGSPVLKCLFTAAATETNPGINALREESGNASVQIADGAVGKAYSSGYPVWSSVKELIYDSSRKSALENCKIETAFAVPIFSTGDVSPSCVLSCYSLLPAESVPFVLNFVQKAVRLLWSGLDRIVNPHESVGRELWKDVGPADLGEMAADVEMQKAFIGKKRPHGEISTGRRGSYDQDGRDRSASLVTQMNVLPNLAPAPAVPAATTPVAAESPSPYVAAPIKAPINAPPAKGLAPAPILPNRVQERSPHAGQFLFLDSNDGHWAVQQAVQSVGDVQLWSDATGAVNTDGVNRAIAQGDLFDNYLQQQQQQQQQQQYQTTPPPPQQTIQQPQQYQQQPQHYPHPPQRQRRQQPQPPKFQMSYVNYMPPAAPQPPLPPPRPPAASPSTYLPSVVHTDDPAVIQANLMEFNAMAQMHQRPPQAIHAATAPGMAPPPTFANNINGVNHASNGIHHVVSSAPNQSFVNGATTQQQNNHHISLDKMVVIPLSQGEGSVILTGPQQSMMYCTSTAHTPMGVGDGTTQGMDPSLFALDTTKPCRIEGCTGFAVAKRPYCERHCGNRQCEREGCKKCAQGATRFCIAHGGGRRCTFPGCDKGARDKYYCAAHGGGKRCKKDGCNKSAVGGSNFCTGHGGGKRCQVPGCDKSAQSSTKFCVKHGGGKKCQHHGCEKVARGRTMFCAAHGGGVRCKLEGCNRVAIGKAQLCRAHGGGAHSQFNAAAI